MTAVLEEPTDSCRHRGDLRLCDAQAKSFVGAWLEQNRAFVLLDVVFAFDHHFDQMPGVERLPG